MKKWFFILSILFVNYCYASVEVILKPNPAIENEEVQLIIKQKGNSSGHGRGLPDVSLLSEDFQVVGTQQSMSYQVLNGVAQQENIWTIILLPKHSGQLKIPALKIGDETTPVQNLQVEPASTASTMSNQAVGKQVYLTWDIKPKSPVLHEQIKVRLNVYHQVPLLDAKLSPPSADNSLLFSIDNHQHNVEIIDGQKYEVETYDYLIYPQKIGTIHISSPVLDALQYDLMPTPIHIALPEKIFKVKAPETDVANKDWLPAANLTFEELSSTTQKAQINLGETFTRRIKITGMGVPANIIPDLQVSCGDSCKVYSHIIETKNKLSDNELYGSKVFELTYLPRQTGRLSAPNITMHWFNTKMRHMETLTIPGMSINVLPEEHALSSLIEPQVNATESGFHLPTWLSGVLGLLLGMVVMKLLGVISWSSIWPNLRQMDVKNRALKQACMNNDAAKVRVLFLEWARRCYAQAFKDLHEASDFIADPQLKIQIDLLVESLFKGDKPDQPWNGKAFWATFKKLKKAKKSRSKDWKIMDSLNPQ